MRVLLKIAYTQDYDVTTPTSKDCGLQDGDGVEIISEGGFARGFCIALIDFYESCGGKNYFTMTVETTVNDERKRYEVTIRNLNGNKSPAEAIKELKDEIEKLKQEKL